MYHIELIQKEHNLYHVENVNNAVSRRYISESAIIIRLEYALSDVSIFSGTTYTLAFFDKLVLSL